jgi:hypothetical protein
MAQTKEQRTIVRQQLELEAIEQRKRYLLTVPKRLVVLTEMSKMLGIWTEVTLTENGPLVKFRKTDSDPYIEDVATYEMDEWQLDELENRIIRFKEKMDAKAARVNAAIDAWAKLTKQEREGIKENIDSLPK